MVKFYCIICGRYRKFKNPKISHIFQKKLVLSITCGKCSSGNGKIF